MVICHRIPAIIAITLLTASCFPTLQSPRIEPGIHLDAGATLIADQPRNGEPQGTDYLIYFSPSIGYRDRFELGIPIGIYLEEGFESLAGDGLERFGTDPKTFAAWPYAKVALTESGARDHVAVTAQAALFAPASIGVSWGRDLGNWEPHIGATLILSMGPAGDDPLVTRYQEADQYLVALQAGAELATAGRPMLAVGLLRNHYREGGVFGDFGQDTVSRTLWDLFVGLRFRLR